MVIARGRGVEDHQRHVALLKQWRERHRVRREIHAGEILHLVLDDQLLAQRLGFCRVGGGQVAIEHLDVVAGDLGAVQRKPGVDAGLEILALERERPGERPDHADLDRLGGGGRRRHADGSARDESIELPDRHVFSPGGSTPRLEDVPSPAPGGRRETVGWLHEELALDRFRVKNVFANGTFCSVCER